MADGFETNAATGGVTFASDDVGGTHYPILKLALGALDSVTLLAGGAGAVSAGVPRVTLASDDPAVASLGILDDWDNAASDGASVSGDVAHDAADAGEPVKIGGYASAAAPTSVSADADRVNAWFLRNGAQATVLTAAGALIGGDATNGLDVDVTRVTGTVTVDGSGVTQPVSNAGLTELAAAINASSQMDVNIAASNATVAVSNAGTFATQVDGAALTALQLIDDPVATLGTTTYTETSTKGVIVGAVRRDADTTLVDTTNEIGPLQMDANGRLKVEAFSGETLPVSLASVPSHAVTNAGTFAVQVDGAALTALQLIDDVVYAEDAAANSADKGIAILSKRVDTPNVALADTNGDWGHITANKLGSLRTAYPEDDLATAATTHVKKYYTSAGAATDGIVWSPAAGARWFLTTLYFNVSAACTVTFEDDLTAGDSAVLKGEYAANSGAVINFNPPMFSGEDAADLLVTTSAGNIYVTAVGYEI